MSKLRKVIQPVQLWAIAVGLVISGEYFGWNYGWGQAGTVGFLIATLLITVMYLTFIFSFTELTTSIPHAGGPFAYSYKAFGPVGGLIAGYACLMEFLLAAPAIAFALGSYIHFLYPDMPVLWTAIGFYVVFTGMNMLGIENSAIFSLVITILAVAGLLLYMGIIAPAYRNANFLHDAMPYGVQGIFAALPFAMWFYVCIEGVAMVAEEVKNPEKNIAKGYISGILTLMVLAISVMVLTGGITDWRRLSAIDYPLPESIAIVLGRQNGLTSIFAGIGLFGLLASFNGIILSYSRQLFALSRSRYLPPILSKLSARRQTPDWAIIIGGLFGIIALCLGKTDQLLVLSVLGAVVMYIMSMASLFMLRRMEPGLWRPFKVPLYPWVPLVALLLSIFSLAAIVYYNIWLSLIFFAGLAFILALFLSAGKLKLPQEDMSFSEQLQ